MTEQLLRVEDLHTCFDTDQGTVRAVDGMSFTVDRGEIVGVIGESGCGKSVTARSILRLEAPGWIASGTITFDGTDMTAADETTLRRIRGNDISMVFQDPAETLNPVFTVGEQIAEAVRIHETESQQRLLDFLGVSPFRDRLAWANARERAVELIAQMDIPNPESSSSAFPHEFSGGLRQRAVLAIALASDPTLLIADEPTTALDTTTQAGILRRIRSLRDERDIGVVLISHDIGVIAQTCDRVIVMYGGQVVETGPVGQILTAPEHAYTRTLLNCSVGSNSRGWIRSVESSPSTPSGEHGGSPFDDQRPHATTEGLLERVPTTKLDSEHRVARVQAPPVEIQTSSKRSDQYTFGETNTTIEREGTPLIELQNVSKEFSVARSLLDRLWGNEPSAKVIDNVSLAVHRNETVGLVGESGCGKSTIGKLLSGQLTPDQGQVRLDGICVNGYNDRSPAQRRQVGVVFQHVQQSFDPRWTIRQSLTEALDSSESGTGDGLDLDSLLQSVQLPSQTADRYPRELSGGQLQRVSLARALAHDPDVIVLDEPVSGLDVATQATVLTLLADIQRRFGVGYVFISHDLDVVRSLADRIAVMYAGELVEIGPANELFQNPKHPYTEALFRAIPSDDPKDDTPTPLPGEPPDPMDRPVGCPFHPRCPAATAECTASHPDFETVDQAHVHVRCLHAPNATSDDGDERMETN